MSITGAEAVDDVYPGYGLPAILGAVTTGNAVIDHLRLAGELPDKTDATLSIVRGQMSETAATIRENECPRTLLHVMFAYDELTLGEASGLIHSDPRDQESVMVALVQSGLVRRIGSGPFALYSIAGSTAH